MTLVWDAPLSERPLAVGRTADLYAWGPDRVVKWFFEGTAPEHVADEAQQSAAAHALGATPIALHGQVVRDGREGLVFDRLDGGSLTHMAEANLLRLWESGRHLAAVHGQLHSRDGADFPEVRSVLARSVGGPAFDFLGVAQRVSLEDHLLGLPAGEALLHMDFHTHNVFEHAGGFAIIDWQTTMRGHPAVDVAVTSLLLAEGELWPGTPWAKRVLYNTVRRSLRRAYLTAYHGSQGVSAADVAAWRLAAVVWRLGQWDLASERAGWRAEILAALGEVA